MALQAGLDLPIINPNIPSMLDAIRAFEVLYNLDEHSARYIENFSRPEEIARISAKPVAAPISAPESASTETGHDPLTDGIKKGLAESVRREVAALLTSQEPEEIINTKLIPALDVVGQEFEQGKIFLPQMIQSAQAAQAGFEEIKNFLANHPKADTPSLSLAQKELCLQQFMGMSTTSAKTLSRSFWKTTDSLSLTLDEMFLLKRLLLLLRNIPSSW